MNTYFKMKSSARIIITGVTLCLFPQIRFKNTYEIIPIRIPFEIE